LGLDVSYVMTKTLTVMKRKEVHSILAVDFLDAELDPRTGLV
jgi:hypothetical protein